MESQAGNPGVNLNTALGYGPALITQPGGHELAKEQASKGAPASVYTAKTLDPTNVPYTAQHYTVASMVT